MTYVLLVTVPLLPLLPRGSALPRGGPLRPRSDRARRLRRTLGPRGSESPHAGSVSNGPYGNGRCCCCCCCYCFCCRSCLFVPLAPAFAPYIVCAFGFPEGAPRPTPRLRACHPCRLRVGARPQRCVVAHLARTWLSIVPLCCRCDVQPLTRKAAATAGPRAAARASSTRDWASSPSSEI